MVDRTDLIIVVVDVKVGSRNVGGRGRQLGDDETIQSRVQMEGATVTRPAASQYGQEQ